MSGVVKCGGYRYGDGTRYIGDWNVKGQKHGMGHLLLTGKISSKILNCNKKLILLQMELDTMEPSSMAIVVA